MNTVVLKLLNVTTEKGQNKIFKMLEKKTQPQSLVNTANVDKAKHSNVTMTSFPVSYRMALLVDCYSLQFTFISC